MPQRSFLRYQLQNSLCHLPISLSLFESVLNTNTEVLQQHLSDFENLRRQNVARLQQDQGEAICKLRAKRVLFLGDSLTADELGYRPLVCEACALLARNGAISGATSASLLNICRQKIFSKTSPTPDILSIMLGTNDSVSIEREELHQVSLTEYARNMREILTWGQKAGARVLLFAIPPILEAQFYTHASANGKLHSNRAIDAYNAELATIANELGIPLFTHLPSNGNPSLFETDGLHLSAEGQVRFAAQWLKAAANII